MRRNGKVMEIPRHDVVVGDVVLVEVGDEVPADGELIVCNDLQMNESTLTGEPVARNLWKAVAMEPILATSSSVLPW